MTSQNVLPNKKTWKDLGIRFVSAVVLVLVCMAPFYFGGWAWAVLAGLFSIRMSYEWVRMSDFEATKLAYALPVFGIVFSILYAVQGLWTYAFIICFLTATLAIFERLRREGNGKGFWSAFGVLYILIPCLTIIGLRGNEIGFNTDGFKTLIFIILVVIAADVGAYFGGSYFKGPKLSPKLSPNKTWSGFLSGLLLAVLIGGIATFFIEDSFVHGALIAVPIIIMSVAGDLFESGLKRKLKIKDTGELIPGHGGLLDRLDSLMAASVGFALLIIIFPFLWPL